MGQERAQGQQAEGMRVERPLVGGRMEQGLPRESEPRLCEHNQLRAFALFWFLCNFQPSLEVKSKGFGRSLPTFRSKTKADTLVTLPESPRGCKNSEGSVRGQISIFLPKRVWGLKKISPSISRSSSRANTHINR